MAPDHEVRRLQEVYHGYRESLTVQAKWSPDNPGNQLILRERMLRLRQMLDAAGFLPLTRRRVLDVGCGSGRPLGSLMQWGALPENLVGVDLLPDRLDEARRAFPEIRFEQANAEHLDYADASFDLALLFTVFTSILDDRMARNVAGEVRRILKPGGAVVWYDFRYSNPRNPHVRAMTKASIQALFPGFTLRLRTVTLLPPVARRLGRLTPVLYPAFSTLPLLRTHFLGLLLKPL